ncbi:MAG: vitamin K epoxide reductase family protein [Patescibacteria group bacterium]|jgi:uncharacterized membrane protein|nr:vitamin K epoxide reductase family protein [Patescibacteria group bacterium]
MTNQNKQPDFIKFFPFILVIAGLLGFLASFGLTIEYINTIKDPAFVPVCDINPIFSCGSVMETAIAEVFGVSNTFFGVIGYTVVITTGMAMIAGAVLKRWYMLSLWAGSVLAMIFLGALFYTSLYVSGALCLFCMTIWVATIPIFWYTTLYNLQTKNIALPEKYLSFQHFIIKHHLDILVVFYVIPIMLIIYRFWYYWSTLI